MITFANFNEKINTPQEPRGPEGFRVYKVATMSLGGPDFRGVCVEGWGLRLFGFGVCNSLRLTGLGFRAL